MGCLAGMQGRRGAPVDVTVGPVMAGPGRDTPTARRHALTQAAVPAEQGFRLVTYNLLADQYASSDKGKTKLFAYCPTRCCPDVTAAPARSRIPSFPTPRPCMPVRHLSLRWHLTCLPATQKSSSRKVPSRNLHKMRCESPEA